MYLREIVKLGGLRVFLATPHLCLAVCFLSPVMIGFLLCGVAHAQHPVGKMPVVTESAVTSQKLLIVPGLQELLQEIVPVQTCHKETKRHQKELSTTTDLKSPN